MLLQNLSQVLSCLDLHPSAPKGQGPLGLDKKDKIQALINTLSVFGINYSASKKESTIPKLGSSKTLRFKLGRKSPNTTLISFRKYELSSGQLPTAIQERGSTFVLERAVRNRKKKF